mmetsp:Transcript_22530/g.41478  ORF Transcript_22530/g.41478 Transcript_22530/m.41478 type:complete len:345 (+) Transcript_22530:100-1134(+)
MRACLLISLVALPLTNAVSEPADVALEIAANGHPALVRRTRAGMMSAAASDAMDGVAAVDEHELVAELDTAGADGMDGAEVAARTTCPCNGGFRYMDRVTALLPHPSGALGIRKGDYGVVRAARDTGPVQVLVEFDDYKYGHTGHCEVARDSCASFPVCQEAHTRSLWWVTCDDIQSLGYTGLDETCSHEDWSDWTECSRTCGHGTRGRSRAPLPATAHSGQHCGSDVQHEAEECAVQGCPGGSPEVYNVSDATEAKTLQDCMWGTWSEWEKHGHCSKLCSKDNIQIRTRFTVQGPRAGGWRCRGPWKDERVCGAGSCTNDTLESSSDLHLVTRPTRLAMLAES